MPDAFYVRQASISKAGAVPPMFGGDYVFYQYLPWSSVIYIAQTQV
jgi:hypothetical protein